jgi:HSP20 family molecular chaperone IbpA
MVPYKRFDGAPPPRRASFRWGRLLPLPPLPGRHSQFLDDLLPVYQPSLDVRESPEHLLILADLPGLTRSDVEVTVTEDRLVICGERERDACPGEDLTHVKERPFGTFHCALPLPPGLDLDRAAASLVHGVLTVRVPKLRRDPPRKVPIGLVPLNAACDAPRSTPPPGGGSGPLNPAPPRPEPS